MATPYLKIADTETISIPECSRETGTFSVEEGKKTVTGDETEFLTEYKVGDFIVSLDQKFAAKIGSILSDTQLLLENPSSETINDEDCYIISAKEVRFIKLGIAAEDGDCEVNGETLFEGLAVNYSVSPDSANRGYKFIQPTFVTTAGQAIVSGTIF